MLGAIIGDIIGSRFEWNNIKTKDFELFNSKCFYTDDSVLTIAVAQAIYKCMGDYNNLSEIAVKYIKEIGINYPDCGYGNSFRKWLFANNKPYYSYGNGAAMRVSAAGFFAKSLDMAKDLAYKVTAITHNHPEGIKGAEAVAVAIYLAKTGIDKSKIKNYINTHYYQLNFSLDDIREDYTFDVSCQGSVPQAITTFFEANSFEDAIRNAISIGGDSDTIGAISGSIAEAYYGIPKDIKEIAYGFLDDNLINIINEIYKNNKFY